MGLSRYVPTPEEAEAARKALSDPPRRGWRYWWRRSRWLLFGLLAYWSGVFAGLLHGAAWEPVLVLWWGVCAVWVVMGGE